MSIIKEKFKRKKKEKIFDLKIDVKDFGPISSGKIKLKPLTLFIGPNNSGKSYASMLIHSILESYVPTFPTDLPRFMRRHFFAGYLDRDFSLQQLSELKGIIGNIKENKEIDIPKNFIKKIIKKIFEEIYEKRLSEEIIRSYACPLNELVRVGKKTFELGINFNSYHTLLVYQKNGVKIKKYPRVDIKIKFKIVESYRPIINVQESKNEILIELSRLWRERESSKFHHLQIMDIISEVCVSHIFKDIAKPCYYLPAARSGILQGHRALAASIVRKAPYVGIERLPEIPKFSGVVSDFISSILTLPEEKSPFYELAKDFEKELIKGEILVRPLDEYLGPEIKYRFMDTEIPLHRASSTVSELEPLFLYLKYTIDKDSILIIEEPEAHLHPQNQRILAKFLVKMIRNGLNIIITTHSEYLLEQLNTFILLSKIKPKDRKELYEYTEEDFLKPEEVAAYVFEYDQSGAGNNIAEIDITEEDGISQEEFLKIHEALYEEAFRIRKSLNNKD